MPNLSKTLWLYVQFSGPPNSRPTRAPIVLHYTFHHGKHGGHRQSCFLDLDKSRIEPSSGTNTWSQIECKGPHNRRCGTLLFLSALTWLSTFLWCQSTFFSIYDTTTNDNAVRDKQSRVKCSTADRIYHHTKLTCIKIDKNQECNNHLLKKNSSMIGSQRNRPRGNHENCKKGKLFFSNEPGKQAST